MANDGEVGDENMEKEEWEGMEELEVVVVEETVDNQRWKSWRS